MIRSARTLLLLLVAAVACSTTESTEPLPTVTLLVSNSTCDPGPCRSLQILGFPDNQPHTPGGLWSIELGFVTGPSVCLTLPASQTFRVTNVSTGMVTSFPWTVGDSLALGSQADPNERRRTQPSTAMFIPAHASGWSVTVPGGAGPAPALGCVP